MEKQADLLFRCALVSITVAIFACSDLPPAQQPKPVSKQITIQKTQPEVAAETQKDPATEASRTVQQIAAVPEQEPASRHAPTEDIKAADQQAGEHEGKAPHLEAKAKMSLPEVETGDKAADALPIQEAAPLSPLVDGLIDEPEAQNPPKSGPDDPSRLIKESLQVAVAYDPSDRFDPFEPLFKTQSTDVTAATKSLREKRAPQTPLERVALSQLKVTAIIRSATGNRALVEDAVGKGYVVQRGTYIGLNAGRVVDIDKNRIVVEEEIENIMGELTIQNAELKLQKTAGEL